MTIKNEIARDILAYLLDNPDAQDTLEGIIQWWLLEQQIKYQTKLVKEAIEELVEKRLILERKTESLRTRYQINRQKMKDIQTLLDQKRKTRIIQTKAGFVLEQLGLWHGKTG